MPSYPADGHKISKHSCFFPGCPESKLRAVSMHICKQCKMRHYCGTDCQKADWPRHKDECKRQAASLAAADQWLGTLHRNFDAWWVALGASFFMETCVDALAVHDHREHIQTKFVFLCLQEKAERPSTPSKMFTYKSVAVLDRGLLNSFIGNDHGVHESMRESDEQAKREGTAGAALILVYIAPADGKTRPSKYFRVMPVVLSADELRKATDEGWKDKVKDTINEGRNRKGGKQKKKRS
ncbi:hypothetical protein C8R46DRAFT_1088130 [Mycena filopes]|nr:hypothetical protein C8R46DRAFT_1088130 [Mycena filopes]